MNSLHGLEEVILKFHFFIAFLKVLMFESSLISSVTRSQIFGPAISDKNCETCLPSPLFNVVCQLTAHFWSSLPRMTSSSLTQH